MDKKLIIAGVILILAFAGIYLYVSNQGNPGYTPTAPEFRENIKCNQFLTGNDIESVMGGKWMILPDTVKVQGDICTMTFQQDGKSLVLSVSPSSFSGINVYDLLYSKLKNGEYASETNELGEKSFRVTSDNVKKVVFQKNNRIFIISSGEIDFNDMVKIGKIIEGRV